MQVFDAAIRGLLVANADIAAAVGERIYKDQAPTSATTPYIVFSENAGRTDVITFGMDGAIVTYNVRAVSDVETDGREIAETLSEKIRTALHRAQPVIPGWGVYKLQQQSIFSRVEQFERQHFAFAGGLYRLEVDQAR